MFAGADCGGECAAAKYSLLETAKLNGVNPQDWLADVLDRVGRGYRSTDSMNCSRGTGQRSHHALLTVQGSLPSSSAGSGGALSGRPGTGAASGGFFAG